MDVNYKNTLAIKIHSDETRKLLRLLEKKVEVQAGLVERVLQLEAKIAAINVKLYSGGSSV